MKNIDTIKKVLSGFLFGFSIVIISFAVYKNPSHMPPPNPFAGELSFYLFSVFSFLLSSLIFIVPLVWKQRKTFFLVFYLSFFLQLSLLVLCSIIIHRDFLAMVFQLFIMYPLILFSQNDIIFSGPQAVIQSRRMYNLSVIFFVLWSVWLLMMGYALVTRQEPRWAESLMYNIYTLILILMTFIHLLKFRSRMYRRVYISSTTIRIDNHDFTEFLGKVNFNIIHTFILNYNKNVTCFMLIPCLTDRDQNNTLSSQLDCEECLSRKSKVTLCSKYKNIYNRILEIKKLFESLEIGTIISPDNKMKILTEGWKLRFFDDIRFCWEREDLNPLENISKVLK